MQEMMINAVGAQGDGLARTGDGKPAFVPLTLPGETILAHMDGARGEIAEILKASADRVTPPCRHFGVCGGCALQHWAAEPYLAWKAEQVRIQLSMEGLETEILPTFAAPPASRRRVALHARKVKGGAALGFKERRSWNLVPIEECPVTDPRIVAALPALSRLAEPFLEHPKSAPTLHVTLTATGLDIDVTGVERKSGGLSADARMRAAMAAGEGDFARVTLAGETVYGARQPLVKLGPAVVALPAGSFLQAVPAAERAMVDFAVAEAQGASRIADLYCGVGTFTFRLAEIGAVHAADSAAPAVAALKVALGSISGLKPITAEARDLVRRPVLTTELAKTDVVVVDPPRAGAAEQTVEVARSKVAKVISVSCNPATFAKDARVLVDAGFRLDKVLPVDQFVWSPHIELVGVFSR
ncbi:MULTISPECIES: class I SAM-dependent RNA methyltransferase [unclassified Caulobacter]|jgi:23S rRNA (uracil1939-C5)-methyltransferase|uniref:class I SAM-dependent RNA methyltransferase n=1 Tax=unclassified Caulobacter TaxID=2648921 RepID=UPI0006F74AC4|nr:MULTISPECIES: class I SAM-dependent RNA methyltransferase [unclassified Caulobacter]KQV56932.1 RNA methyltransferase [Caulobacter sp. Root342]KQV66418.1 RNA methyltransferase [Caulobacter sp. Root343]